MVFAGLLCKDPSEVRKTLVRCEILWLALERAEEKAKHHTWVRAWLDTMLWPNCSWAREILVGLAEAEWKHCPSDLLQELEKCFSTAGTKEIEDSFNVIRRLCRQNLGGKLGPLAKWHSLSNSGLIEGSGGVQPQVLPVDQVDIQQDIPAAVFSSSTHHHFTLGDEKMEQFRNDDKWKAVTGLAFLKITVQTQAFLKFAHGLEKVQSLWRSELLMPGMLFDAGALDDMVDPCIRLVVCSTPFGAVCWPCDVTVVGGMYILCLQCAEHASVFEFVEDHSQYWAFEHKVCNPRELEVILKDSARAGLYPWVCHTLPSLEPISLIRYQAKRSFVGLTTTFMHRLLGVHREFTFVKFPKHGNGNT